MLELALPAAKPDAPTHDVKRHEKQRNNENQDLERYGGDIHIALIGMTGSDFRRTACGTVQYNAAISVQLYAF